MPLSLYLEVANTLAKAIDIGDYREREALPAERALSEEFHVSRETIRKAIKLLETQGYLVPKQGRGTFVAPDTLRGMHRSIDGWSDEARRNKRQASQAILKVEVVAGSLAILRSLGLSNGAPLVRILRIQSLDGKPVGTHESFLSVDRPNDLTERLLEASGSLYKLLADQFGITLTDAAESISAVAASHQEAEWLGLAPGIPLLRIERITLSDELKPVEFCVMKYAQSYSYDTVVRRRNIGN